jgi:hypothetical protein
VPVNFGIMAGRFAPAALGMGHKRPSIPPKPARENERFYESESGN